jgi:hypothetical protein
MAIAHLVSLATGEPQQESFLQVVLHHPVFDVGFLVFISGTVVGNIGISKMIDAVEEDVSVEHEMFSTGEMTAPRGGRREAAIAKYQETQPDGPFYRILQRGWVLNAVGLLIMIGSVVIAVLRD